MRGTLAILLAALASVGCVAPAPDDADPPTRNEGGADATVTPFSFDGRIPAGASAGTVVVNHDADRWRLLEFEGILIGANFTMTWEAASPGMRELRLGVGWNGGASKEYVDGPSPLTLTLEGLSIRPDDKPTVWAFADTSVMETAGVTTPQDFRIEGEIVTTTA